MREAGPLARQTKPSRGPSPGAMMQAVMPRELERFMDHTGPFRTFGVTDTRGSRATLPSSYAASISWDGLSIDPRPFARFDEHDTFTETAKPVGSAGVRVVELEGHRRGGIFGRPASGPGRMQWTVEQETSRIFAPDNPFAQMTTDGEGIGLDRPYFDSTVAVVPKVEPVRPPTCVARAGPRGDGALLSPNERRQMNNYEVQRQSAMRVGRKAHHQKIRLHYIMRNRYPEGALNVDSPSNPCTEVYTERNNKRDKAEAVTFSRAAARRKYLDDIQGHPEARFGYNPWQHPINHRNDVPTSSVVEQQGAQGGRRSGAVGDNGGEKFLQTKGRTERRSGTSAASFAIRSKTAAVTSQALGDNSTFHRLFGDRGSKQPKIDPRIRAQRLWDEGLGRRNYDIVLGKRPPIASVTAERPPGRLGHPSQQSLERGRNVQGSLIPA